MVGKQPTRHTQGFRRTLNVPTLPKEYFDRLYRENPDPWKFAESEYEAEKYAATLEALPSPRYSRALEVGCSIGILTQALGDRCDYVVGVDVSVAAIDQARIRNADRPNIEFEEMQFPDNLPEGRFDLIVLSEVLYYFSPEKLLDVADCALNLAVDGADIVLVHWLGPTPDYPLNGQQAANMFVEAVNESAALVSHRETDKYRLDIMRYSAPIEKLR